ncbi:HAD-IA family hydrolase [Rhodovulum visakhapatnamense]|uniref:Putative hydrolase of the HAD superfamily n=1 Tax=Rhodovulum visakhapatnamense TaxID=364297 RepID=A0A4R8FIY4_9RHOB|nr:HAD-IA family hydrolase [Rhodovulum visakhapatnamense]TDX26110.1 putative hydrolase of the HAD superfamily [Rhodovulum visakhapatnamense]
MDDQTAETQVMPLTRFDYVSFDVVGTLIDFEGAIKAGLDAIAKAAGIDLDGEAALSVYRAARYEPDALKFPDDLGRCYGRIAAAFGLPDTPEARQSMIDAVGEAQPFPDSAEALARLARRYKLIAMTNARRWAYEKYAAKLGEPFWAGFTTDETGTEKPDPAFFEQVFAHVAATGGSTDRILHTAQSQHHDIGISRALGMTNCWIQRRHAQKGYGGTIEPAEFTKPDYHFHSLADLADAVDRAFAD